MHWCIFCQLSSDSDISVITILRIWHFVILVFNIYRKLSQYHFFANPVRGLFAGCIKYYLQTFPRQRLIDSWMLTKLGGKNRFLSHAYLWPLWPLQVLHLRFTPLPLNDCLSEWISTGKQCFGITRMVYLGIFTPTASSESTPMSSNRLAFDFGHDSSIESRMSEAMRFLFLHAVTVLVWAPWIASFSSALVTFDAS